MTSAAARHHRTRYKGGSDVQKQGVVEITRRSMNLRRESRCRCTFHISLPALSLCDEGPSELAAV